MYTNQDASTSHDGAAKTRNLKDSAFPTKKGPPIRTTTSAVSGNNISRTNYAPPAPVECEKHVAETIVQTACHHTDRRRGAQPVQLSYCSQKPQIYIKTLQAYRCIHPREHTTNDYIQFIITIFYMNIDKMYRPAPQTHADPNPTYSGMRS